MKRIDAYINEHLEWMNEGLIGDIIMELLRRSLNWVDKGIDLISDNIKISVNSVWDMAKENQRLIKSEKYRDAYNKGEKEFLGTLRKETLGPNSFKARQESIVNNLNEMYGYDDFNKGIKKKEYAKMYIELSYQNYLLTVNTKKTSKAEKKEATEFMEKIMNDSKYKNYIDEIKNRNTTK